MGTSNQRTSLTSAIHQYTAEDSHGTRPHPQHRVRPPSRNHWESTRHWPDTNQPSNLVRVDAPRQGAQARKTGASRERMARRRHTCIHLKHVRRLRKFRMTNTKEGLVGQGRSPQNTNQSKFASTLIIASSGEKSRSYCAADIQLRSAWINSASQQLACEIAIVLLAADQLACGHALSADDLDRLHAAHQHILGALGALINREVIL